MTAEQIDARPALASALVTAVDHVGIAVPDLDVAITWYHDHLGMIVLHEEVNDDQGIREAMLAVRGAPVGSAQIQLMAPLDENSTIAKFLDKRGPGIQQIAYRVSSSRTLRAAARRIRGSTSSIPRMAAAFSSNSSSPPITDAGPSLSSASRPLAGRTARRPVRPARRVPVPPVF